MINNDTLHRHNQQHQIEHQDNFDFLANRLESNGVNVKEIVHKLEQFQVAIPSWALGTGGTRFGRFPDGGEPGSLEEKIADIGLIHKLNKSSGAISLHIPWDIPEDYNAIKALADSYEIDFDAVNSNTFQDQPDSTVSYKYGSLSHVNKEVRQVAIEHNKEVIDHGIPLGSKALTVWLSDGTNHPGQANFRDSLERTIESLKDIYDHLPDDWRILIEYKPYEPHFYSMVIPDWGTSHLIAQELGHKAFSLVDLGHHLPNTNIEQIVSILMRQTKLGGFHFNDSKYGDDDLTVGGTKPYQLFLIFNELIEGASATKNAEPAWMIDASHNLKDPLEDLLQSVEAIKIAFAQALLVDQKRLKQAQAENDISGAQEILQEAFRTDVRPLVAEARVQKGGALRPLQIFRGEEVRKNLVKERGAKTISTGL